MKRGWTRLALATVLVLMVAGCATEFEQVKTGTVYPETIALMESMGMDRAAPIMVRIYKEGSTLEVWKQDRTGRFRLLKSYPICRFSGGLGPKKADGDHQAPEGFYQVGPGQMNPHSREYLSFNLGYPNAYDRALGRTGDSLMVHGGCRSVGCYAMTDKQMEEIYGLAYEAFAGGQNKVQVEAFSVPHGRRPTSKATAPMPISPSGPCSRRAATGSRAPGSRRSSRSATGAMSSRPRRRSHTRHGRDLRAALMTRD